MSAARIEAEKDGVVVPLTLEDYCRKPKAKAAEPPVDMTDFYVDDYDIGDDDDDDLDMGDSDAGEDGDDSGNGESWTEDNIAQNIDSPVLSHSKGTLNLFFL